MRGWLRGQGHGRTSPQDAQSDKWKCSYAKLSLTKILHKTYSLGWKESKGAHEFKKETNFMGQAFESMSKNTSLFCKRNPAFLWQQQRQMAG